MKFEHEISTDGSGYWSGVVKTVKVTHFEVNATKYEDELNGELRVYFDTDSWNIHDDGLIYTDVAFEFSLKFLLADFGLDISEVSYSEQGMQGEDFVSLDVGEKFINDCINHLDVHVEIFEVEL
jgi:hypothetical protein